MANPSANEHMEEAVETLHKAHESKMKIFLYSEIVKLAKSAHDAVQAAKAAAHQAMSKSSTNGAPHDGHPAAPHAVDSKAISTDASVHGHVPCRVTSLYKKPPTINPLATREYKIEKEKDHRPEVTHRELFFDLIFVVINIQVVFPLLNECDR